MINRILIRIKVIQILYANLLVENAFSLEQPETPATRERRFAYALYLDLLVLAIKVADRIATRGGGHPLSETRLIQRLLSDDKIKSRLTKYSIEPFPFEELEAEIAERLKESGLYKNYLKGYNKGETEGEDMMWSDIFNEFILKSPRLLDLIARREDFSERGVERTNQMIDTSLRKFMASHSDGEVQRTLRVSLDRARELYLRLLLLPLNITELEKRQIEERRNRYVTSVEDRNPNMRFVENKLVEQLEQNPDLREFVEKTGISWLNDDLVLVQKLLRNIRQSELYNEYMNAENHNDHDDYEFWRKAFRQIIMNNPDFLETLEDKSVFWNDDLDIMSEFAVKTFRRMEEGKPYPVLPKYKDEEDARFGATLTACVLENRETYRGYIDAAIDSENWEMQRLSVMDVIILMTAIAEILNFPKIPLLVSVNEYIEIAKSYSGPKSGNFIHGMLATIIRNLQEAGVLHKQFGKS